ARLRNAVAAAETALDTIRANELKWQECVTENVTALALTVARHIVGRELSSDATAVADLVKRALAEFPIDQPMRVRINPDDLSMLSLPSADGGDALPIAPNRDVRWLADLRIQPGGCVVEGRERIVDGRIDTALERLYRKLSGNDA
ncbi:MAG: FliH/SctL family protein, partial [Gemmatimonadaceae bacterium]